MPDTEIKTIDDLLTKYFIKGRADLSVRNITSSEEYPFCSPEQRIELVWKFLEQALKGR